MTILPRLIALCYWPSPVGAAGLSVALEYIFERRESGRGDDGAADGTRSGSGSDSSGDSEGGRARADGGGCKRRLEGRRERALPRRRGAEGGIAEGPGCSIDGDGGMDSGRGVVVISSYEGLRKMRASLLLVQWDSVCLDEGQKIRNPTAGDVTNSTHCINACAESPDVILTLFNSRHITNQR